MIVMRYTCLLLALAVMACDSSDPTIRYQSPDPMAVLGELPRVRIVHKAVEVREVSLPGYAASEEIAMTDGAGQISTMQEALWADAPARLVTLNLSRALTQITRARIAPDPWPFQNRADAVVDVRFDSFVADPSGTFQASGMFFVAPDDPERRERAGTFNEAVAFDPEGGFPALAAAQSAVVGLLAQTIAKEGLR